MTIKKSIIAIITAILLALTTMGGSFVFAEPTPNRAPEENKIITVDINWIYASGLRWYNNANDGNNIELKYYIGMKGINKKTGEKERFNSEIKTATVKIGTNSTFEFPLGDEVKSDKGEVYKDVNTIYDAQVIIDAENLIYSSGTSTSDPYHQVLYISQCMNTDLNTSIKEDAIILDKHKDNIIVKYTVEKTNADGEKTSPLCISKRKIQMPIAYSSKFNDGENIPLYEKERQNKNEAGFHRTLIDNRTLTNFFVPANGEPARRTATYRLVASFDGDNKAELEKYYTLTVTGDDEKGWNVELGSKIKSKKDQKVEKKPFKTIYKDDPNMLVGKTKKEVKGVIGKKIIEIETLYVTDDAGNEEILDTREEVISDTEPVDEVILRGSKNPESIKDGNENPQTSDSEVLYTYLLFIIASVAATCVAISKRREEK